MDYPCAADGDIAFCSTYSLELETNVSVVREIGTRGKVYKELRSV